MDPFTPSPISWPGPPSTSADAWLHGAAREVARSLPGIGLPIPRSVKAEEAGHAVHLLAYRVEDPLRDLGEVERDILELLCRTVGCLSQRAIAVATHYSLSTIRRHLDRLVSLGHVEHLGPHRGYRLAGQVTQEPRQARLPFAD